MTSSQQNYTSKDALKNKVATDKSRVDADKKVGEKSMKDKDCGC